MKKYLFIFALSLIILTLAGCGDSLKSKAKLSRPVNQNTTDNTLQTGRVAGDQDSNGSKE